MLLGSPKRYMFYQKCYFTSVLAHCNSRESSCPSLPLFLTFLIAAFREPTHESAWSLIACVFSGKMCFFSFCLFSRIVEFVTTWGFLWRSNLQNSRYFFRWPRACYNKDEEHQQRSTKRMVFTRAFACVKVWPLECHRAETSFHAQHV